MRAGLIRKWSIRVGVPEGSILSQQHNTRSTLLQEKRDALQNGDGPRDLSRVVPMTPF